MAIIRSAPDSQPALTFDHIYMTRLEILQPTILNDATPPMYHVQIQYREYGVDAANVRHFKSGEPVTVGISDFYAAATEKAAVGDMDLINAMVAIQAAVAQIITDQTGVGTTVV